MSSGFIHVVDVSKFHSFLRLSNTGLYVYFTFCLSVGAHLDHFQLLAIVNSAAVVTDVQVCLSPCFQFFCIYT